MIRHSLSICYLTKRQNAIAGIANQLRLSFPKVIASQAASIDALAAQKELDIIIADPEFKNVSHSTPVLYIISEKEASKFINAPYDFVTDVEAGTHALVRAVKNILERRRLSENLKEATIKDEMTGLYNQRFLLETLAREVKKATRYSYPLTLLYIGIDGIRKINGKFGHAIGDRVIVDFGLILTNSVRCVDTVGRFSGDEFLAILPETPQSNAIKVCERIRNSANNLAFANGEAGLNVTAGIGISSLSSTTRTKEELLNSARAALAGAKKGGENTVCTFEEARLIDEPTRENKELISAIQRQITMFTEEAKKTHFGNILKLFGEIPLFRKTLPHAEHVAFYSERLANKIGLSAEDSAALRQSTLLHDIGKLAIDERIVMKNGALTSTEYAIVKQHPVFAAQMLADSAFLKSEVNTILHHHEHFDGNGYPDHMQSNFIPMSARIIGLAEAWDTMISEQPYRNALPLDRALAELKRGAGQQFDPELVTVFTGLIEN